MKELRLKELSKDIHPIKERPIKVIQFGEGNFLRAFVDWMIQKMNDEANYDGNIAIVQPLKNGLCGLLDTQDCLYTHFMKGLKNGEAVSEHYINDSVSKTVNPYEDYEDFLSLANIETAKIIISNTTEAGIDLDETDTLEGAVQKSFPGKLTALLYRRFKAFKDSKESGFTIIPCELIENNGTKLKEIVLTLSKNWGLEDEFITWIHEENIFCNTLVDRIVPGYPRERIEEVWKEIGYKDQLVVESEQFNLWVIDGPDGIKDYFPIDQTDCNVLFVKDITPYRTRKVRILNGAHTTLVPVGYLYGIDTVRESLEDEVVGKFIRDAIYEEIIPTLDLSQEELESFAKEVIDRFLNPFVKHQLLSISLNSMPKYRTRVLPSLLTYIDRKGVLPKRLVFALASLIVFYRGDRKGSLIPLKDSQTTLDLYKKLWDDFDGTDKGIETIVEAVLAYEKNWGRDLNHIKGLKDQLVHFVKAILASSVNEVIKEVL